MKKQYLQSDKILRNTADNVVKNLKPVNVLCMSHGNSVELMKSEIFVEF